MKAEPSRKLLNFLIIIIIGMFIFLAAITIAIRNLDKEIEKQADIMANYMVNIERLEMKDPGVLPQLKYNGFYFPNDKYYCVWAQNRTPERVTATEAHEYCHYLVDVQWGHFCG